VRARCGAGQQGTGHETDVETGLVNMRGRIYDPLRVSRHRDREDRTMVIAKIGAS
jgi:hypothetical protein